MLNYGSPEETNWIIYAPSKCLKPLPGYMAQYGKWMLDNNSSKDDPVFLFKFHTIFAASDVYIHQSRLEWAGGPFAALVRKGFMEFEKKEVQLSVEDDPKTFGALMKFLYSTDVNMDKELEELLAVARSAHRWGLVELFRLTCRYVEKMGMFMGDVDEGVLIRIADITEMPDIPEEFRIFFWRAVGRQYETFSELNGIRVYACRNGEVSTLPTTEELGYEAPVEARACPRFPQLWNMAIRQGMVSSLVASTSRFSFKYNDIIESLVDVVLLYVEPRLLNDLVILDLLYFIRDQAADYYRRVLKYGALDDKCSSRAMRLLARVYCRELLEP